MIAIAAQLFALVAVASAQYYGGSYYWGGYGYDYYYPYFYGGYGYGGYDGYGYDYYNPNVYAANPYDYAVGPASSGVSEHYSYPYTYVTYFAHHKEYVYTYETCSSPPSSIEVCLSSVFSSMEVALTQVVAVLNGHEASIKAEMHHEHTLLYSEVSWVSQVESIAESVGLAVEINYDALYDEVKQLTLEKNQIDQAYIDLEQQLEGIEAEARNIQNDKDQIYQEYQQVAVAKWSVYQAISAIVYEKIAVQEEEAVIEEVIADLNAQMSKIAEKIDQLNKRQNWLVSWEVKLYADLSEFQVNINRFKEVEDNLEEREESLYNEQARLLIEAEQVQEALAQLHAEYVHIVSELENLQAYEKEIQQLDATVIKEANVFISAYEEFTCEDSLLYYEACSSTAPAPATAAS